MIITDDFVLVNYPKTGTTFTRQVLKKIYSDRFIELLLPESFNYMSKAPTQHGALSSIPDEHKHKQVVSIIRHPFDRYVSMWKFKWYINSPPVSQTLLSQKYPNFPDIDFKDFLNMTDRYSKKNLLLAHNINTTTDLGFQTLQFIAFYGSTPRKDLTNTLKNKTIDIPKITWIRQSNLRNDLKNLLLSIGFNNNQISIIDTEKDLNTSRDHNERDWHDFWDNDIYDIYCKKEEILINKFSNIF